MDNGIEIRTDLELKNFVVTRIIRDTGSGIYEGPCKNPHATVVFNNGTMEISVPIGQFFWYENDGFPIPPNVQYKMELGDEYVLKLEKVKNMEEEIKSDDPNETLTLGFSGA